MYFNTLTDLLIDEHSNHFSSIYGILLINSFFNNTSLISCQMANQSFVKIIERDFMKKYFK